MEAGGPGKRERVAAGRFCFSDELTMSKIFVDSFKRSWYIEIQ
jgi:hypothetical protein